MNSDKAQATLESALFSSGSFTASNAISIARAFSNAKTSSNVDLTGITTTSGAAATLANINAALQTSAAASSIYQSSLTNFSNNFNATVDAIENNPSVLPSVSAALSPLTDPSGAPLFQMFLGDYRNQYGAITPSGALMQLLEHGTAQVGGATIDLNTASPDTIVAGAMQVALDSTWSNRGNNAAVTCSRLANDVSAAVAYDNAHGVTPPSADISLTSPNGTCVFTPSANGTSYSGTWLGGLFSGSSLGGGDLSTDASAVGGSFSNTFNLTTYNSGTSNVWDFSNTVNKTGSYGNVDNTISGTENTSGSILAADIMGNGYSGNISHATLSVNGQDASIQGQDNTITCPAPETFDLQGNNNNLIINGGTLNTSANATGETLSGSGYTLNASGLFSGSASGTNDTFNLSNSTGSTLTLSGASQVVNGDAGNVVNLAAGTSATINGAGTVGLDGANDNLTLDTSGITLDSVNDATGETIDGSGFNLKGGAGEFTATVIGSNNVFNLDASSNSSLTLDGANENVFSNGNNVALGVDSSGTIMGSGVDITVVDAGSLAAIADSIVTVGGNGEMASNAQVDTVNFTGGQGDTLNEGNDSRVNVDAGSGLTLNLGTDDLLGVDTGYGQTVNASGANDSVWLSGNGEMASSAQLDTVNFTGGQGGTVNEGVNSDLSVGGSGVTVNLSSNDDLALASGAYGDDVLGSNANITGAGITDLTLDGNDDVFKGSGSDFDVSGQSTGDDIYLSNATIDVTGDQSSVDIFGSNDHIVGASGDSFTITGTDDPTDATNASVMYDGSNLGDYVSGTGNSGSNWDDPDSSDSGGGINPDPDPDPEVSPRIHAGTPI